MAICVNRFKNLLLVALYSVSPYIHTFSKYFFPSVVPSCHPNYDHVDFSYLQYSQDFISFCFCKGKQKHAFQ